MSRLQEVHSVEDIRMNADRAGSYFFSVGTMRFWRTRVLSGVYRSPSGQVLFVTSDRSYDDGREYRVRSYSTFVDDQGLELVRIDTVAGPFPTARRAQAAARLLCSVGE